MLLLRLLKLKSRCNSSCHARPHRCVGATDVTTSCAGNRVVTDSSGKVTTNYTLPVKAKIAAITCSAIGYISAVFTGNSPSRPPDRDQTIFRQPTDRSGEYSIARTIGCHRHGRARESNSGCDRDFQRWWEGRQLLRQYRDYGCFRARPNFLYDSKRCWPS